MADEPHWMEEEPALASSRVRTGVKANPRAGLKNFLFLGGLVAAVGVAGVIGTVVWGPEKSPASHSHFASEPSASASADPAPSADPAASAEPSSADPAPSSSSAAPKKRRRKH